jgi:uncharacterized membrane protein
MNKIRVTTFCVFLSLILNACNGKIPGADARKVSYDPKERVKKNLEEGRGFRLDRHLEIIQMEEILNLLAQMNFGVLH